jgi:TatD DNase family protein
MNFFIDSHCHLTSEKLVGKADIFIEQAKAMGVQKFGLAGVESSEWNQQLELSARHPGELLTHFGLHPWWVESFSDEKIISDLSILDRMLPQANGLGETGLDYTPKRNPDRFLAQVNAFQMQIDLALKHQKPIILHVVHAHSDALKILKDRKANQVPLLCHSYSGNVTMLDEFLKLGAYISFNGCVARSTGYESVKKALVRTPLDRLLFETDAPDQAEHAGELNHPKNVVNTYQKAAAMLEVSLETLTQKVSENYDRIYSLS